jgi:hypothetical protein
MHCALVFEILLKDESNILQNMSHPNWSLTRRIVVELILATDMAKHFDMLGTFRSRFLTSDSELSNLDTRIAVLKICIKCADVGHAAKKTELHEKWSMRVI